MPITVEVVSRGVDWAAIAAIASPVATVVVAAGGIWGTTRQARIERKATADQAETERRATAEQARIEREATTEQARVAREAATKDLERNLKATAENLLESIRTEDRRCS